MEQDNFSWPKDPLENEKPLLPFSWTDCSPRKAWRGEGNLLQLIPDVGRGSTPAARKSLSGTPFHNIGNSCKTPISDVLLFRETSPVFAKKWLWMANQPCIYFKKTWKQPCYFWKHGHLFRVSWQGGVTVESSLKNRESVVPPTALLRVVTSDLGKQRQKVPPWKSPKLTQPWQGPTADSSSEGAEHWHREMQEWILPKNFATKHGGPSNSTKFNYKASLVLFLCTQATKLTWTQCLLSFTTDQQQKVPKILQIHCKDTLYKIVVQ